MTLTTPTQRMLAVLWRACLLLPVALLALLAGAGAGLTQDVDKAGETKKAAVCETGANILDGLAGSDELAAIETQARNTPNGEGRLFRIEREGRDSSYLFGTMHLSDPRVLDLPDAVDTALQAAKRVVIETTDILDEAIMATAMLSRPDLTVLPAGTSLSDVVPADQLAGLTAALESRGMPFDAVRTLQPWFLTMGLVMPACETARQADGAGVLDLTLAREAKARGQSVIGLETGIEQIEALASMPPDLQAENLLATLDLVDRMPDVFETMIELYVSGRIAMIAPTIERIAPSGTDEAASAAVYAAFDEQVVVARNHRMAERLAPLLKETGGTFVAIGALHLPGEEGVVELLRQAGWTVTRAD